MYKIGEFSKITGLTVKALRYYDEQKILVPSTRCENSYRIYNEQDFEKAGMIKLLRSFDFSISEIKDVLRVCKSMDDLYYVLREKQEIIKQNIISEKKRIEELEKYLSPTNRTLPIHSYEIEEKETEAVNVASIRFKGQYYDLDRYVPILYKAVKGFNTGRHFSLYYDEDCMEEADIELCVPIRQFLSNLNSGITQKKLPARKALSTVHIGSYEHLKYAYKALFDYAAHHNLDLLTPSREIYIHGPGMLFKGNPDSYQTEILIPCQ